MQDDLGQLISRARLDAGLSLRATAERLDVSHTAVRRWEEGRDVPSPDKLPAVAEFIGRPEADVKAMWDQLQLAQAKERVARANSPVIVAELVERVAVLERKLDASTDEVRQLTDLVQELVREFGGKAAATKRRRA